MDLTLRSEITSTPGTPADQEHRSKVFQWLHDAAAGRLVLPTCEGLIRPPSSVGMLSLFWWTRHPKANPVVVVFDDDKTRTFCWDVPDAWNEYWCSRFVRDAEELDRQMNRGEEGKRLSSFRLGTVAEVVDFIEGSLRAYAEQAH